MSQTSNARGSKMLRYINWRLRVRLSDKRSLVGTFLAFDRHMNIVLADTEETRIIRIKKKKKNKEKEKKESTTATTTETTNSNAMDISSNTEHKSEPTERVDKRPMGLVLIRGCNVISLFAESKPAPKPKTIILNPNNMPSSTSKLPGTANTIGLGRGQAPAMPVIAAQAQIVTTQTIQPVPTQPFMGRGQQPYIQPPPIMGAGRGYPQPIMQQQQPMMTQAQLPPHLLQQQQQQQQFGRGFGRGALPPHMQQQQMNMPQQPFQPQQQQFGRGFGRGV